MDVRIQEEYLNHQTRDLAENVIQTASDEVLQESNNQPEQDGLEPAELSR